jgi:hypothetical protein
MTGGRSKMARAPGKASGVDFRTLSKPPRGGCTKTGKPSYVHEDKRPGRACAAADVVRYCTKAENELRAVYGGASAVIEVTATGLPCLAGAHVTDILYMYPPIPPRQGLAYKGYMDLTYVTVPTVRGKEGWNAAEDAEALDAIFLAKSVQPRRDIGKRAPVKGLLHEPQARILLKVGNAIREHEEAVRWCLAQRTRPVTVVEHNLEHVKLHRPWNHPLYGREPTLSLPCKPGDGDEVHSIATVTQMLKDENQDSPDLHNHIAYVAGLKADRGASFVSLDFGWHLTHMYMVASEKTGNHLLVQSGGRLTGMYADDPRLVLYGSEETLRDYFLSCESLRELGAQLWQTAPEEGAVMGGSGGMAFRKTQDEIVLLLQGGSPDRAWAARGRAKRLSLNQTWQRAVKSWDDCRLKGGVHVARRLYPAHRVLDHYVELEAKLSDRHLDLMFDIIHRRGPAEPGEPPARHMEVLRSQTMVGPHGKTNRLDDLLSAVREAAVHELDGLAEVYGDAFRIPAWVNLDPLAKKDGLLMEDVSMSGGGYRYRAHRNMTKGRRAASHGGRIDYLAHSAFIACPTPSSRAQARVGAVQEISRTSAWKVGIVVRLVPNADIRTSVVKNRQGEETNTVSGPVLYWTAERHMIVRHASDSHEETLVGRVVMTQVAARRPSPAPAS